MNNEYQCESKPLVIAPRLSVGITTGDTPQPQAYANVDD